MPRRKYVDWGREMDREFAACSEEARAEADYQAWLARERGPVEFDVDERDEDAEARGRSLRGTRR